MALYWPEARFALDLMEGEVPRRSESEYPPGVLVLSVREEQVDDPEFLEEVRELIIRRTERCLGRALEIGYGLATSNAPQVQLVINGCGDVIVRPGQVA